MPEKNVRKRQSGLPESPSPAKKAKYDSLESDSLQATVDNVLEFYAEKRNAALPTDGGEFKFNKKRVRMISKVQELPANCKGIIYWMFRDQRVEGKFCKTFSHLRKLSLKQSIHNSQFHCLLCNTRSTLA